MYNVVIIGGGNLGSRHLQGLAKVDFPVRIFVVDVSYESLRLSQTRYLETPVNESVRAITFTTRVDDLPDQIDLAVIATNAGERLAALRDLLSVGKVRYVVLEKVAFQSEEEFKEAEVLLSKAGAEAWVNCPRRMVDTYAEIRELLKGQPVEFTLTGGDWGLATSSIHFHDLAAFISDCRECKISPEEIDPSVLDSKRPGYIEMTGTLCGLFANGGKLKLQSVAESKEPIRITMVTPEYRIEVDEAAGEVSISGPGPDADTRVVPIRLPYQSELSQLIVEDLLKNGTCRLTSFQESKALHLQLLAALNAHIEKVEGRPINVCPIT